MGEYLHKIGPVAVVAAVFTWCCWPYITGTATTIESKEPSVVPILSKRLLSPLVKPAVNRDPFDVVKAAALGGLQQELAAATRGGNPLDGTPQASAAPAPPSLVLTGTYRRGNERMTIIDGKIYRLGQTLDSESSSAGWKVIEILTDHVVLERKGKTKVITYPDPAASPRPSDPAAAAPSPGSVDRGGGPSKSNATAPGDGDLQQITSLTDLIEVIQATTNQKP